MKKRILALLLILCVCICPILGSCGDSDKEGEEESGEVTFDSVNKIMRKLVNERIEYAVSSNEEEAMSLLDECFYEAYEEFDGTIKNALYCEYETYRDWRYDQWWCVVAFECESEDEASVLKSAIEKYEDEDLSCYRLEGKVLVIASNEDMADVAVGKKAYTEPTPLTPIVDAEKSVDQLNKNGYTVVYNTVENGVGEIYARMENDYYYSNDGVRLWYFSNAEEAQAKCEELESLIDRYLDSTDEEREEMEDSVGVSLFMANCGTYGTIVWLGDSSACGAALKGE